MRLEFERVPWLSLMGASSFIGMILNLSNRADPISFMIWTAPLFLAQILMLIVLGIDIVRVSYGRTSKSLISFFMALDVTLQIALWKWGNVPDSIQAPILAWFLAIIQGCLASLFFAKIQLRIGFDRGFTYGALSIVAVIAFAHLISYPRSLMVLISLRVWPLSLLMVCLGYILPFNGVHAEWVNYLKPVGAGLGLVSLLILRWGGLIML
jgi:hypothetical protein